MSTATLCIGLPAQVNVGCRVLLLGSMPGVASLQEQRYYAHPRNRFWPLMADICGFDADLPYAQRLQALKAAGIGLWDVIASAERAGSLDAAIRSPEAADLRGLVAALPHLRAIAFNGGLAARMGRRVLAPVTDVALIDLPSSSPAHVRPLADKAAACAVLKSALS